MNSDYRNSSRLQRIIAVLAASVLTGTLFAAVALGLTGDDGWSLLTQYEDGTSQAVVQLA